MPLREEKHGRAIFLPICLALISCATIHPSAVAEPAASEVKHMFDGVWASRGYGWLWEIKNGKAERYDIGEGFCIPKSSEEYMMTPYSGAKLSRDGRTLRLRLHDPDYFYTFDRLAELPALCRQQAPAGPEFVFDVVVSMFDAHYAFFEERGVDWERTVERARSKLCPGMNDADLLEVLQKLLAPFADSHVGIEATIDGEDVSISGSEARTPIQARDEPAIDGAWNARAAVESLQSVRRRGDDVLLYGQLTDDIGYLQVQAMSGLEIDELEAALDDAMTSFSGSEAVIVDVSGNYGGLDSFGRLIARRFAAVPTIAYSKYAGDFEGDPPQDVVLQPPERPRFLGPVYLITGHDTVSAAEVFAMSMRALPNVVHLGERTDGSLSDELWKTLPNGWILSLSNEVYLDSEGALWEGSGIPPEILLAISEKHSVSKEDRQSVQDLVNFIRTNAQEDLSR